MRRRVEVGRSESTPAELMDYARDIGSVVLNLLSLEFAVRAARSFDGSAVSLDAIRPGDRVASCPLTGYDSLGKVLDAYNAMVDAADRLDRDAIVRVRDMLAHGRLVGMSPRLPFTLYKFGAPRRDGAVAIEAIVEVSSEWLAAQRGLIANATSRVLRRLGSAPLRDARPQSRRNR